MSKRSVILFGVGIALILVAAVAPFAYQTAKPTTSSHVSSPMDTCQTMRVELNNNGKPANKCLRTVAQYKQLESLMGHGLTSIGWRWYLTGYGNPCQSSDVQLWTSINYQPDHYSDVQRELCFYGIGWTNLTNYQYTYTYLCWYDPAGGCVEQTTWNDQVSSFKSGSWWGYLDWDTNTQGAWLRFLPNESCANIGYKNMGNNNANWNDKASTVEIIGSYSNGANAC